MCLYIGDQRVNNKTNRRTQESTKKQNESTFIDMACLLTAASVFSGKRIVTPALLNGLEHNTKVTHGYSEAKFQWNTF